MPADACQIFAIAAHCIWDCGEKLPSLLGWQPLEDGLGDLLYHHWQPIVSLGMGRVVTVIEATDETTTAAIPVGALNYGISRYVLFNPPP